MTQLKHIGIQIHSDDVNRFYVDILNGKQEGVNTISAELSYRIFQIDGAVKMVYLNIGDVCLEMFLGNFRKITSYQHICLEVSHPELMFRLAVERGFDAYAHGGAAKSSTYFIKDTLGNIFELKYLNE